MDPTSPMMQLDSNLTDTPASVSHDAWTDLYKQKNNQHDQQNKENCICLGPGTEYSFYGCIQVDFFNNKNKTSSVGLLLLLDGVVAGSIL